MVIARTSPLIAALSFVLVVVSPCASVAAVVPCRLTIDMGAAVPLAWSEAAHQTFRREATRMWSAEGVRFCWTGDGPCPQSALLYVRVVPEAPVAPDGGAGRALGWMGFSKQSGPGPLILLSERWAVDLLGRAERGTRALASLPRSRARARTGALPARTARAQRQWRDARGVQARGSRR
jgi:hypothetical protein